MDVGTFFDEADKLDGQVTTMTAKSCQVETGLDLDDKPQLSIEGKRLTPRAVKNLSRLTRIPKHLLLDCTDPNINRIVQEQLVNMELPNLRTAVDDRGQHVFFQDAEKPYLSYSGFSEFFPAESTLQVQGSPYTHDAVRFVTKGEEVDDGDMWAGLSVQLSSTLWKKAIFDFNIFRVICENGMIASILKFGSVLPAKDTTVPLVHAMMEARGDKLGAFADKFRKMLRTAKMLRLDEFDERVLEGLEADGFISKHLMKRAVKTLHKLEEGKDERFYEEVGMGGLSTAWEYMNLLTWEAKGQSLTARPKSEEGIFRWGMSLVA